MRSVKRMALVLVALVAVSVGTVHAEDKVIFDFEGDGDAASWAPLSIEGSKLPGAVEPAAKVELAAEGATSGKRALKITFDGGRWPTVTTTAVPLTENWVAQKLVTFKADVTVPRVCLVGIRVLMENRKRDNGYTWVVTKICQPGKNELVQALGGWWTGMTVEDGKVTGLDVFMYDPQKGESIAVDNIRLTTDRLRAAAGRPVRVQILGTDLNVLNLNDLARQLRDKWQQPVDKPIEQVEADFRAQFDELKKTHPKAVFAVFREGDKGFDPAAANKVYKGWKVRHINSHGPDCAIVERAQNIKGWGTLEAFMRHRSLILQADLSSIPKGSDILAAKLILTRAGAPGAKDSERTPFKPNMWVAEPVNRPWVEAEVNAFEYAKDKFWKSVGAMSAESYEGDDPDFVPAYIAHGPSTGVVNVWDFTDAVKWFTDGKHPNYGFFFHGDSTDYIMAFTAEAKDVPKRPAVLVIYEPK